MKITVNDKDYSWISNLLFVILAIMVSYYTFTNPESSRTDLFLTGIIVGWAVPLDLLPLLKYIYKKFK